MNRFKLGEPLNSVVRKHLLTLTKPLDDDDIEIAIYKGWTARDSEVEQLKAENTRVWELHNDFLNSKMTNLQKEIHELRSENARYREWLNSISHDENCECGFCGATIEEYLSEALKGK